MDTSSRHCPVHPRRFLFPPGHAFFSLKHVGEWVAEDLPKLRALGVGGSKEGGGGGGGAGRPGDMGSRPGMIECVQGPGDLMFVPDMWGHAVLNEEDSIAVAYEFHE